MGERGLRDIGARLPPGFRFYPNDEELVCHYLKKKVENEEALRATSTSLVEIDLHTCEPWQLPEVAKLNDTDWYFFSFRDRKYATGFRTNRATKTGYWKATGKDRVIHNPRTRDIVGMRKTLVFYQNRAPNGIKTGWIMHEFRLESPNMPPKEDWVLCRVFHKGKEDESMDNTENSSQQMMFDDPINAGKSTTSSSPSFPFKNLSASVSSSIPPTATTTTWGMSSSSSCQIQQQENNPTNSFISSNFISSASEYPPENGTAALMSNSATLNPICHEEEPIIKVGSNTSLNSFTDLINMNAMNDDDYGFLWDMDLDQEVNNISSYNSKLDDYQGSNVTVAHPHHDHQNELGKARFDDSDHVY